MRQPKVEDQDGFSQPTARSSEVLSSWLGSRCPEAGRHQCSELALVVCGWPPKRFSVMGYRACWWSSFPLSAPLAMSKYSRNLQAFSLYCRHPDSSGSCIIHQVPCLTLWRVHIGHSDHWPEGVKVAGTDDEMKAWPSRLSRPPKRPTAPTCMEDTCGTLTGGPRSGFKRSPKKSAREGISWGCSMLATVVMPTGLSPASALPWCIGKWLPSTKALGGMWYTEASVAEQLILQSWLNKICLLRDRRLLRQDYFFGCDRVRWEKAPINIASISKVRIIGILMAKAGRFGWNFSPCRNPNAEFIIEAML